MSLATHNKITIKKTNGFLTYRIKFFSIIVLIFLDSLIPVKKAII